MGGGSSTSGGQSNLNQPLVPPPGWLAGNDPVGNPYKPAGVIAGNDPVGQPNQQDYYAGKFFGGGLIPHGHGLYGTGTSSGQGNLGDVLPMIFGGGGFA